MDVPEGRTLAKHVRRRRTANRIIARRHGGDRRERPCLPGRDRRRARRSRRAAGGPARRVPQRRDIRYAGGLPAARGPRGVRTVLRRRRRHSWRRGGRARRAGAAICWENNMPLLRAAMYAKGVQIWCAPTVDERDVWQSSMRHIAQEGRCFVVSACQVQPSPRELGVEVEGWDADRPLIAGGSVIVGPLGDVLAGPRIGGEGLVCAQIDTAELAGARYDLDVVGHYARPDVFT